MKTIKTFDAMNVHNNVEIPLIDEVIEAEYDSIQRLYDKYSGKVDLPIIMVGAFRGCSMFYRIRSPFEITTESHLIYKTPGFDRYGGQWNHNFAGPELVAELAHPGEAQICHYENNQVSVHPENSAECWDIVFGNYAVILPAEPLKRNTRKYPAFLIMGDENCRRQLSLWNIADVGKKTDLFGAVVGHVDGLL